MKKQELIEKIKDLSYTLTWNIPRINREIVIDLIEQLDEPQKPIVPQFVADWYEENKDDFEGNLFRCIDRMPDLFSGEELSVFEEWLVDDHTKPFQILVNMHQFGYEVEKEKRYLVKVKNIGDGWEILKWNNVRQYWYFGNKKRLDDVRLYHTLENLQKGGFGNVFVNPLFTIEEVEG